MIDSHAHLYWDSFQEDFDEVLQRAVDSRLTHIINIGVDLETSQKALKQAQEITKLKVFSTIGLHPHDAQDSLLSTTDVSIQTILGDLEGVYRGSQGKVVAVGECGLDFYSPNSSLSLANMDQQRQLFKLQVDLAKKLKLPLIIHCRNSWDEIFDYLEGMPGEALAKSGVFHCWSGSYQDAQKALNLGFYISFAGNITYPQADNLRQVAQMIPLDRILMETDSPFLSPEGKRGTRNEPANVALVAHTLAQLRQIPLDEIVKQTAQNTIQLFHI